VNSILRSPLRLINRFPLRGVLRDDAPFFLRNAIVNINGDNITESGGAVTSMINQGTGGAAFDLNVIVGDGDNLKKSVSDTVLLFGGSGDKLTTADDAAHRGTGDFSWIFEVSPDDWTALGNQVLAISGDATATSTINWQIRLMADGSIELSRPTGSTARIYATSDTISASDGAKLFVKVQFDQDNGASASEMNVSTSTDGLAFSALGVAQTNANTGAGNSDTTGITVGSDNLDASRFAGNISAIQAFSDKDTTTRVLSLNAADYVNKTSDTEFPSSATGEIWELVGNSFIQNTGHNVVQPIGGVGLETTAGQDITSPGTVFAVIRYSDPTPAADQAVFDARASLSKRWLLALDQSASNVFVFQGEGSFPVTSLANDTDPHVITCQFNGDSTTKITISGVGSFTGDDVGSDDLQWGSIFVDATGGSSMQGYIDTLIIFVGKLKESEVSSMQAFLAKRSRI